MTMLKEADLYAPDALIECDDGSVIAVMFYYAGEETTFTAVAKGNGYECKGALLTEGDALWDAYTEAQEHAEDWRAFWRSYRPTPPEGWTLAYTGDTEDGPMTVFVRPMPEGARAESKEATDATTAAAADA